MAANKYGLYLSRGSKTIRFPVNPKQYRIQKDNDNESYNVIGIGEVVVPRIPKPQVISWDSFFPGRRGDPYVLTSSGFKQPEYYIRFLQEAMDRRKPVRFVANRYNDAGQELFDTNLKVLVTSFEFEERGGETGDFYYSLTLTEYRDYAPQMVDIRVEQTRTLAAYEPTRSIPEGEITVGAAVICNGAYFATSYGEPPSGSFSGYRGKVSRLVSDDSTRAYPVHITSPSGGWMGWVEKSQVQVVSG